MISLLKNGDFVRLFLGRIITNAGDSLYTVAAMWLVYELGGSSFYTGLAGFLVLFPNILQFLAGPLVDRWSLKSILIVTQIIQGILVLVIPIAAYFGWLNVTLVLIIMPLISIFNQFVYPAQSAALPIVLKKEQLVKGNSAFTFAYQGVDLVFNALAGILVAMVGAISLFLIDSITFAIAVILFVSLKMQPKQKREKVDPEKSSIKHSFKSYINELKEGIRFVMGSILKKMYVGTIVANFAIGATLAVLPAYADWRGGPEYYGLYMSSLSAGGLIGALFASAFERFPLGKLAIIAFAIGGSFWIVAALIPSTPISILLFGLAWIPVGITNVLFAAAMQAIVPEHLLARAFSVGMSVGTSAMPIGSLLGGFIAAMTSSVIVFSITAVGFLFISVYMSFVTVLRRLPKTEALNPEQFGFVDPSINEKL